jgi:hypothetical protein
MEKIKTVCYGREETWETREEAEAFFLQAMAGSEGSEQERYTNIYLKLQMGMTCCTDDDL